MGSNYPNKENQIYQSANNRNYQNEKIEFPSESDYRTSAPMYGEGMDFKERRMIVPAKSRNTKIIILICILIELIVALTVVVVVLINRKNNASVPTEVVSQIPSAEQSKRFTTFNPGYDYSKLPGLVQSTEVSDGEFLEMKSIIEGYNDSWIRYVNYGDSTLYNYLLTGTKAYINAKNFDRTGLTEEFLVFEINDVRKTGNTYYVWSHEIINKHRSSGTTRAEYHWIYIIKEDSKGRYVERYEKDPYYN